ncbi:hypothetical protein [Pedobacter helvus]|uniref:Uncharacterized protein n=1 Tax=Pedobacter helvus TaxID=2563444 RepID=A0ABW9JKK1_9SPHI|nr:hypothetical protein [Pedobacter ureilyticus]
MEQRLMEFLPQIKVLNGLMRYSERTIGSLKVLARDIEELVGDNIVSTKYMGSLKGVTHGVAIFIERELVDMNALMEIGDSKEFNSIDQLNLVGRINHKLRKVLSANVFSAQTEQSLWLSIGTLLRLFGYMGFHASSLKEQQLYGGYVSSGMTGEPVLVHMLVLKHN